jgi:hypothetical protein
VLCGSLCAQCPTERLCDPALSPPALCRHTAARGAGREHSCLAGPTVTQSYACVLDEAVLDRGAADRSPLRLESGRRPRPNAAADGCRDHDIWIAGSDDELLRLLHGHHVRTVISNDYWEGLRLTFESGETIITVMVTPQGHPGFNRYQPYVSQGLADPRPAYLELSGTVEASLDLARYDAGQLPGYALVHTGEFVLLLPAT